MTYTLLLPQNGHASYFVSINSSFSFWFRLYFCCGILNCWFKHGAEHLGKGGRQAERSVFIHRFAPQMPATAWAGPGRAEPRSQDSVPVSDMWQGASPVASRVCISRSCTRKQSWDQNPSTLIPDMGVRGVPSCVLTAFTKLPKLPVQWSYFKFKLTH